MDQGEESNKICLPKTFVATTVDTLNIMSSGRHERGFVSEARLPRHLEAVTKMNHRRLGARKEVATD